MGLVVLGIFLIVYGLFCLVIGLLKAPKAIWNMAKIEAFKKLLGELGTQIFITIWGLAALAGGIALLAVNLSS